MGGGWHFHKYCVKIPTPGQWHLLRIPTLRPILRWKQVPNLLLYTVFVYTVSNISTSWSYHMQGYVNSVLHKTRTELYNLTFNTRVSNECKFHVMGVLCHIKYKIINSQITLETQKMIAKSWKFKNARSGLKTNTEHQKVHSCQLDDLSPGFPPRPIV